jgi:zinc protease
MGWIKGALALALGLSLAAGAAAAADRTTDRAAGHPTAQANNADEIAPTTAVTFGALPNGLRYAILHNVRPAGAVSVRLAVGAGSYDEAETELGVAHFVEHMTFAAGGEAQERAFTSAFQALGVDHGRDRNAHTGLRSTSYELDLPRGDAAGLDLAFKWLRQVADGATFPDAVVAREKGVLLAERAMRGTAMASSAMELAAFEGMDTRSARRELPEPADSIQASTPARLREFYSRWYRPDNAVVVIVGDISADDARARIKAAFGSWASTGPPPLHDPPQAISLTSGPAEKIIAEPNGFNVLTVCRATQADPSPAITGARLRSWAASRAWAWVLSDRLVRVARENDPPFAAASAVIRDEGVEAREACLAIMPRDGDWTRGLAAAQTELRRFAANGPSPAETAAAIKDLRDHYYNDQRAIEVGESPAIAQALARRMIAGEALPGETADTVFRSATATITAADLTAALTHDWSGAGPRIGYIAPARPPAGALKSAWAANDQGAAPAPYVEAPTQAWPYASFGKPGRVVKHQTVAEADYVRLTFDNGVILNVKSTTFNDHIVAGVSFGTGRHEFDDRDFVIAQLGSGMVEYLGLKQISYRDMYKALHGKAYALRFIIEDETFLLLGETRQRDMAAQMEVLAAYASEPGFRSDMDAALPTALGAGLRMMRSQPTAVIPLALGNAMRPGKPSLMPSDDVLTGLHAADFAALLDPPLLTERLEVTLVGDITEKQAIAEVAKTFGALPARRAVDRSRPDAFFLRGLDAPLSPVTVSMPGAASAAVGAVWPLWVATSQRRREELAMHLAGRILSGNLRRRIREQLGKTYSPFVEVSSEDNADQGLVMAMVDTAPADVELVRSEILAAAATLAKGDFDAATLDQARAPMLAQLDAAKGENLWWMSLIAAGHGDAARLHDLAGERDVLASLSLAEVKQAAAAWLSKTPTLLTALPEAAPPGTPAVGGGSQPTK